MKQITFASILLAVAIFFAGCSKDTPGDVEKQEQKENLTTLDAGSLRFNFVEEGFGEDIEQTRGEELPKEEIVDVGNGLEAHISVERDAVPTTRAPKPIADGNYTILAYKGTQRLDQKITFKVVGGVTSITSTKGRYSWVANATYTFVCFNDKVIDNNNGTLDIWMGNKETALLDKQTITINGADQNLTFQMKHVCMRVRTKLVSLQEAPKQATATFVNPLINTPYLLRYHILSDNYTNDYFQQWPDKNQNYTQSGSYRDSNLDDNLFTATADEYTTFFANMQHSRKIRFTAGTVYDKPLQNMELPFTIDNTFKANGSYTIVYKLMPKYLYLFEDGQTGYLSDAGRKTHVPIAIVFDVTGKRAISLWDANGGNYTKWDTDNNFSVQRNSITFSNTNAAFSNSTSGQVWTWESWDSKHNGISIIKADDPQFVACYYAGNFYNSSDLISKATLTGANINKREVWYLPSWHDWKEVLVKLGFGDGSSHGIMYFFKKQWKGSLVNYAFSVANGTSIVGKDDYQTYWASSEFGQNSALCVRIQRSDIFFYGNWKSTPYNARPFVAF